MVWCDTIIPLTRLNKYRISLKRQHRRMRQLAYFPHTTTSKTNYPDMATSFYQSAYLFPWHDNIRTLFPLHNNMLPSIHYSMATGDATTNCYCIYKPGHQCSYGCYQTKDYGSYYAYGYQAWYAVATVATKPTADRSYQPYSHRWVMVGCTSTSMITTW